MIELSSFDLMVTAFLIFVLAGLTFAMSLRLAKPLLIAAARTAVQLTLIGLVLKALFATVHPAFVAAVAVFMWLAAGREVTARQKFQTRGPWRYGVGLSAMFVSSFALAVFALVAVVSPTPWYHPQYAIPLLGMLLGNTMNAVALSLDRLLSGLWQRREEIEHRLLMGQDSRAATLGLRQEALRAGMIPMINAMAAAGLVSLPGMMTGQILAGSPPAEAVKYQIFIMFLITAGTGFGSLVAVRLGYRRLFDQRDRLRLDRLHVIKDA